MSSLPSASILRDLRRSWPGLLISLICLVAVFSIADFRKLKEAIALADYGYVAPALVVFLLAFVTRAFAWRALLKEKATPVQTFFALNEGYLLNNLLPFRLGEIGRGFLLSRTAKIGFLQVMSSILIERVLDLSLVVGILLIAMTFVVGASEWAQPAAISVAVVLLAAVVFLFILAHNRARALAGFERLQTKVRFLRRFSHEQVEAFFDGLAALTDFRRFLVVVFLLAATWGLVIWHYYLILLAFVPEAGLAWAAFGLGVVGLGVAVPSAPGSVGVVQGVIVAVFPPLFGVDPAVALAYSITVHAIYLAITSALGLIGLLRDGNSLGAVYADVRAWVSTGVAREGVDL
ncbi:MAG TPA: lysylphosphatidylglycerol synthase transmembrane domain-containing protein [Anaerolineales bacterium]|nr:lysylphosphatidylglycerol synthase transmembrane domain-containing protein [Anaerolineales bacterium]